MQATVLFDNRHVGQAHDIVLINQFHADRVVLDMKLISMDGRVFVPLVVVVDGREVNVKLTSFASMGSDENGLATLRDVTMQVIADS